MPTHSSASSPDILPDVPCPSSWPRPTDSTLQALTLAARALHKSLGLDTTQAVLMATDDLYAKLRAVLPDGSFNVLRADLQLLLLVRRVYPLDTWARVYAEAIGDDHYLQCL